MTAAAAAQIRPTTNSDISRLRATAPVKPRTPAEKSLAAPSIPGRARRGRSDVASSLGASDGITVTATTSDKSTATEIATAMSRNSCPTSRFKTRMGMNTVTVVSAETSTAPNTCRAPRYAASKRGMPCSRKRKMFSSTTIAASTTMPTAKAIPAREITFSDRPIAAMATKVPITVTGIDSPMISVARPERRNMSRMSAASVPPIQMCCTTKSLAEVMYSVSS